MGRPRACGWAGFRFRRGWDKIAKEHRGLWDRRISDQGSNVQKHIVQGIWFHPNTSIQDLHVYEGHTFKAPLSILTQDFCCPSHMPSPSGYSTCLQAIPPGLVMSPSCHPGIFLPLLLLLSIKPFFQWQTGWFFYQPQTDCCWVKILTWCFAFLLPMHLLDSLTSLRVTKRCLSPAYCVETLELNFSNRNAFRVVSQAFKIQGPPFLSERAPRTSYAVSPWRFSFTMQ